MRILQVGPIPPEVGGQTRGGVATHVWGLATHLVKRGHQVGILADNYRGAHEIIEGVEIYSTAPRLNVTSVLKILNPHFWIKALRIKSHFGQLQTWRRVIIRLLAYEQVIERFQPDVIHVHHLEYRFPFAYFSKGDSVPIVTTAHSTASIEFAPSAVRTLRHQLVQRNLKLARHIIFVSRFLKQRYETLRLNIPDECKTWIIHNPMDVSLYYPIPKADADKHINKKSSIPLLLFVGNLIPQKGAHVLVEAADLLRTKGINVQISIIGDGPQREELKTLVEKRGLTSAVFLEGPKSQLDLLYYYNAADLFVLPSLMESFGLVFIEAMLCGCPVIGTPKVLDELLPSDDYGYRVSSDDPGALAGAIEEALRRSWDRKKIREYACTFDWSHLIGRFESVYKEVAKCD